MRPANPVVGVIYNARSHRNKGRDLEIAGRANVFIEQPARRSDIAEALRRLAGHGIDYLVINGGDGTVRDVLTCANEIFGDDWPELAVLPKGKTNALNVDLGAPGGWNLADAIAAWPKGKRIRRRPISIEPVGEEGEAIPGCGRAMLGFILGGGAFTLGVRAGQDAHRMGAFNSFAVGVTSAWGILRGVLGSDSNEWRRGTPMQFSLGERRQQLSHGRGEGNRRRSVFLASTLERFPAGMKLFDPDHSGLKLTVLDHPHRRILATMPAILAGWVPQWVRRKGLHQIEVEEFELEIGDEFILDGEAYPAGTYRVSSGPELTFVVP